MIALQRRLGLGDSVVLGLGSMIGAGIFVALAPAAKSAGSYLLVALLIAAFVALHHATKAAINNATRRYEPADLAAGASATKMPAPIIEPSPRTTESPKPRRRCNA